MAANKYIIIADDDPDDHMLFSEAFERMQFPWKIYFAGNGTEVIEFLENNTECLPEFILLDLNMPLLDGYKTLQHLKASALYQTIPISIMSTSGTGYDQNRCLAAGAEDYIIKPHSFDAMVSIVQQLVHRNTGEQEVT